MNYRTDINYRKESLKKLLHNIRLHENEVTSALHGDFKKPEFEAYVTEIALAYSELKLTIKNLNSWAKPKNVWPSLLNFPSSDAIHFEPYGEVLIVSPWNYPFLLAICPLIGAVAAGNKVVLKPSELAPHTSAVLSKIISKTFDAGHVTVKQGGAEVAEKLLEKRWDYIFFTGSVAVGKIVAAAAARNLTPVTLELGGKNPCIVDETAKLPLAAKRIIWGKMVNAGQTCIAPDYILVHHSVKEKLLALLQQEITVMYGQNPMESEDFARIISLKNWKRQISLLENHKIYSGGQSDEKTLYISPTIVDEPAWNSTLMQEEIFGPILPVKAYADFSDLTRHISTYEKPLALYLFSSDKKNIQKTIGHFSFGGGCINDTVIHFGNERLPFGGVGHSGIGAYHGKRSFDTFSHKKSIVKKATWLDIPMRYAPYKNKLPLLKKMLNWL